MLMKSIERDCQKLNIYGNNYMKVVILAGGFGTRLSEFTNKVPNGKVG